MAVCLLPLSAAADGRRVAVVVGNSNYTDLPLLETPPQDAMAIAAALGGLGFDVTQLDDPDKSTLESNLSRIAASLDSGDTVLFYYAGHALQKDGVDLLVPSTAKLADLAGLNSETWRLQDIADTLRSNNPALLFFLDASHKNPLSAALRGPDDGDGLAQFSAGANSFVAFAASPGMAAVNKIDGASFSPFATALLARLGTKDQSLSDMMILVRNDVETATNASQIPWEQSSLREQFYFAPSSTPADDSEASAFDFVSEELTLISAPPPEGRLLYAQLARIPQDLPLAIQAELKRVGCYKSGVDGDWGDGSRKALAAFYKSNKQTVDDDEPTEAAYRAILAEPERVCAANVAAAATKSGTKSATAKSGTKASGTKSGTGSSGTKSGNGVKPSVGLEVSPPTSGKPNCRMTFVGIAFVLKCD